MPSPRVVFLTPSLHQGGAERWILSLARHFLAVRPAGCLLLSGHCHRAVIAEAERLMPVVRCRAAPGSRRHTAEARALLAGMAREADLLLAWGIPGLATLRRGIELPAVDVSHASAAWPAQRRLAAAAQRGADYLAAVSGVAAEAYPSAMHSAVTVIYNGVEADRTAPRRPRVETRALLGLKPADRLLLFLGRFCREKRPELLLSALEHLPPAWQGVFVGHGPLEAELRRLAGRTPAGRCRFLPPTSQVGDLLAAADVLLLPSRYEGMPLVLLEAWLAGLPTVAARFDFLDEVEQWHGPLSESVALDKPTGAELAAAVERAEAGRFVAQARRAVWNHYTAAAMAQRWEEYLTAVARHAAANRLSA